jgi:hypothetical protein
MFSGGYFGGASWRQSPLGQTGNIIEIGPRMSQTRFPELIEVEAYWNALKGSRQMPGRLEIDPRGIDGALSHAFILERIAPGIGRIRLAGSHLNDVMGMEIRGMPVTALIAPEDRAQFSEHLEQVFAAPARLVVELLAERSIGKPNLRGRMVLLPLTDHENRVTRALGCLSTHGKIGRAPRRFRVSGQHASLLKGTIPLPRSIPNELSFAEPSCNFDHKPSTSGGKPSLRLVKTDDYKTND